MSAQKVGMDIAELIDAIKNTPITKEEIAAFHERLDAAEEKFKEEAHRRAVPPEWLERPYTI